MSKPISILAVATLAVAAAALGGQAAMAAGPVMSYTCPPGTPPPPAACHILVTEGRIRDGSCAIGCSVAAKPAGGASRAWFILNSDRSVSIFSESPAGWIPSAASVSDWYDGGSWSQNFLVEFPAGSDYLCSASAQPSGADYVTASVIHNWSTEVEINEHWTSSPNRFYDAPVLLTCWNQ